MNIFEALRADHEHQRALAAELINTEGASPERERIFNELKAALDDHAVAEERHFYVHLMQADLTQEKARHSVAEHKELDDLIEKLTQTDHSSPGWLPTAQKLHERLTHHLDEEEHEVFQLAGKALSEAEKTGLAEAYQAEMQSP